MQTSGRVLRPISRLSPQHVDTLTGWFQELWWSKGRTADDVSLALSHSLCVGFEHVGPDGEAPRLAGFARVVSDRAFKALILDVVVAPEQRSSGLGRRLVRSLIAHPELQRVKHFELYCASDMGPYYERLGFEHLKLSFMRLGEGGAGGRAQRRYK